MLKTSCHSNYEQESSPPPVSIPNKIHPEIYWGALEVWLSLDALRYKQTNNYAVKWSTHAKAPSQSISQFLSAGESSQFLWRFISKRSSYSLPWLSLYFLVKALCIVSRKLRLLHEHSSWHISALVQRVALTNRSRLNTTSIHSVFHIIAPHLWRIASCIVHNGSGNQPLYHYKT